MSTSCLVPTEVDHVIARCLEREPSTRYQSMVEVASAIDRILHGGALRLAMPLR